MSLPESMGIGVQW